MNFGEKLSVDDFKAEHEATTLDVVKNPKTDKLFVTANGKTVAAVSKNYKSELDKEFVELIMEDTGDIIWCLHNPSNANVIQTL
jgi:hypothetical protein